jgi:1-aminocyclopropane-1-carboxylate deaminase/D-cysteine desulfhydrase-like pyridoxal-dependent ACC family enzyme
VVGVSPVLYRLKPERAADIAEIGNAAAALLGMAPLLSAEAIANTLEFVGPGYGIVSEAGREAIDLLARLEGILLDPSSPPKGSPGSLRT